jgi:hypothetical protein
MIRNKFPYCGFWLSWYFSSHNHNYSSHYIVPEQVYQDIYNILVITSKYKLLVPTYIYNNGEKIYFQSTSIEDIIYEIKNILNSNVITSEIDRIGGYGIVYTSETEFEYQEDLILLDTIRFFERNICITTSKSVWVPINFDENYKFEWQMEIAKFNSYRLENSLIEVSKILNIDVYPSKDELYKDTPVWQKGFKLFVDPEIIIRQQEINFNPYFDTDAYFEDLK